MTSERCGALAGVVLRSSTGAGVIGWHPCRSVWCDVHGARNRADTAAWMAQHFDEGAYRLEVEDGSPEWAALRQRLCRVRRRTQDALGHGYAVPAPGGRLVVVVDMPVGEPVDPGVALLEAQENMPDDGRQRRGLGGWRVKKPTSSSGQWAVEGYATTPRLKLRHRLAALGLDPRDLDDDELAAYDLADGLAFAIPDRGSELYGAFVAAVGLISPDEFHRRRRREEVAA